MTSLRDFRQKVSVWVVAISVMFISSASAETCRCTPAGEPRTEFQLSAAVFSGQVVSMKKAPGMEQRVTFKVLKTWKGPKKKQFVIINSTDPEGCGYEFKKGEKYLVYALGGAGRYTTSLCTRTTTLDLADRDIGEFKK